MAKDSEPRKAPDWIAIERDYRLGRLSNREIARKHDCSEAGVRKRAHKCGWSKDLSDQVRAEAKNRADAAIVRNRTPDPEALRTEAQVFSAVAQVTADVIVHHREDLAELRALEHGLVTRLQGKLPEKFTLPAHALTLRQLAQARAARITIERQAWGLDDKGRADEPFNQAVGNAAAAGDDVLARLERALAGD